MASWEPVISWQEKIFGIPALTYKIHAKKFQKIFFTAPHYLGEILGSKGGVLKLNKTAQVGV